MPEVDLRVLSLGAGVQSTTLLLMAERGEFDAKPDYAIFADTGWEPKRVYEHLAWLERTVTTIPIIRVSAGNIRNDVISSKNGTRVATMPFYTKDPEEGDGGILRRGCTIEYKVEPITAKIRELLGVAPGRRVNATVEQWFGISLDEAARMKDPAHKWVVNRYPLIKKRMDRLSCLLWLDRNGYPRPPKSACIGCPFHSDAYWRELRDNSPDEWADAVEFDNDIRTGVRGVKSELYLHRNRIPLHQVDLSTPRDHGQLDIDDFLQETGSLNICRGGCFL